MTCIYSVLPDVQLNISLCLHPRTMHVLNILFYISAIDIGHALILRVPRRL